MATARLEAASPSRTAAAGHLASATGWVRRGNVTGTSGGTAHISKAPTLAPAIASVFGQPQPIGMAPLGSPIPTSIWIALAAALALAGIGGAATLRMGRMARRQAGEFAVVAAVALKDPLTGVLNRRGFTEAVERELARAVRYDRPFVLAYVDVRGLKTVNDTEGHLAGDELIRQVADLLKESARADDVVGRIGGDELGLLLAEQSAESAAQVLRRIQAGVHARQAASWINVPWGLTIGMAAYPQDGATYDELLSTADRRMYEQRGIHLR